MTKVSLIAGQQLFLPTFSHVLLTYLLWLNHLISCTQADTQLHPQHLYLMMPSSLWMGPLVSPFHWHHQKCCGFSVPRRPRAERTCTVWSPRWREVNPIWTEHADTATMWLKCGRNQTVDRSAWRTSLFVLQMSLTKYSFDKFILSKS